MFIEIAKAFGNARSPTQLGGDYDTMVNALPAEPAPDTAAQNKARTDSEAVNTWLLNLKQSNPAQFETVRRETFEQLKVRAGVV